jgi:hypothetical protein
MRDPLATYLHDHLAGAALAIDLLKSLQRHNEGEPLVQFAKSLLADIEADRDVLRGLTERVGIGSSAFKELTGWLSEKVSRVKLGGRSPSGFDTFEALEFLQLGIHEKWALWQALAVVAATHERLRGTDFLRLATRAATQESQVEQQRLQARDWFSSLLPSLYFLKFFSLSVRSDVQTGSRERYCVKGTRSVTSKVTSRADHLTRCVNLWIMSTPRQFD